MNFLKRKTILIWLNLVLLIFNPARTKERKMKDRLSKAIPIFQVIRFPVSKIHFMRI